MPIHVSAEERSETGLSLELIGGIILFFDFLVLFFLPAGLKLGQQSGFAAILGLVAVAAFAVIVWGHIIRLRANREE